MGIKKAPPEAEVLKSALGKLPSPGSGTPWQRYRCKLVTPMYGGGVNPGEVDEHMPIRATSIRGQLRFWWRMLNKTKHPESKDLFREERNIWGGLGKKPETLQASKIVIRINSTNVSQGKICEKDRSPLGKMIITEVNQSVSWLSVGHTFEMEIHDPTGDVSVMAAIRLWASFGGLGARRRRGMGAIEVIDESGQRIQASKADWEAAGCHCYLMPENTGGSADTYRKAVEKGLERLTDFRQKPGLARGAIRENRPGGSLWPEANAVRRLTGRARQDNHHALQASTPIAFPRALFGLPIVFQFKLHERQGDPFQSTLEPSDSDGIKRDRFASPLIFTALAESRGLQTHYRPAVLLLPSHLELRNQALKLKMISPERTTLLNAGTWWPADPNIRKNLLPPKYRNGSAGKNSDVLSAFINHFIKGEPA